MGFNVLSIAGVAGVLIEIGDAGGMETSGYNSQSVVISSSAIDSIDTSASGFLINVGIATTIFSGYLTLKLIDEANETWAIGGAINATQSSTQFTVICTGRKSLSAELTQLRIFCDGENFDAGDVSVSYRGA